ncbi:hypothetical protein Tco_1020491 [Tanacetum coccineum]
MGTKCCFNNNNNKLTLGMVEGVTKPYVLRICYYIHGREGLMCVWMCGSSYFVTDCPMADFVPGRAVIDAAQRKRGKYITKCADIGYGFLPFSFSSFGELQKDAVTLLKRVRKFSMAQDIRARAAVYIFNRISFSIVKGVGAQIVSRLPSNLL